jgi:hypothetical protein
VPNARLRWRYRLVANGFAVVLRRQTMPRLREGAGLELWPNVRYHSLSLHVVARRS